MKYRGYESTVEYDEESNILHGDVLNLMDVITFEADCVDDLEQAFHDSVDDYLAFCEEQHRNPEKPFSGNVLVRMPTDLHKEVTVVAKKKKTSVNSLIVAAIQSYVMKVV